MNRLVLCFFAFAFAGCSIQRTEDPDRRVRDFLVAFESSLSKPEERTLEFFAVKQSRDAILAVIRVLKNQDQFVVCTPSFVNAIIDVNVKPLRVEIPVVFHYKGSRSSDTVRHQLKIDIEPVGEGFKIVDLEGESFYQAFQRAKHLNAWEAALQQVIGERAWIFENARYLDGKFDSVVWYTQLDESRYFYVARGSWQHPFSKRTQRFDSTARLGLVNQQGEIVIPLEYELIGTIGFLFNDKVEVARNGHVGYFDMNSKRLIIDAVYDWIAPYDGQDAFAIAKKDTLIGWLDFDYTFNIGFKNDYMRQWVSEYRFLKHPLRLTGEQYAICEIPARDQIGNGYIIPPTYLSRFGVLNPVISGMITTKVPFNGWTEYVEKEESKISTLTSHLSAIVTIVKERYLEGREEFYTSSKVLLVSSDPSPVGSTDVPGEIASIRMVDTTLMEIQTPHDYWFMDENAWEELNLVHYTYLRVTNQGAEPLKSKRLFPQTEFVKLDSSYITGNFVVYNAATRANERTKILSQATIMYMRNEILAFYGYTFPELVSRDDFYYLRKGKEPIDSIEVILSKMSDVDRHNLDFFNTLLEDYPS
ncbi:MAG: hypothetical protein ACK5DD_05985 [Cyclobacteriaceae bacterium]|jgi:hypothetical protein